MRQLIAIALIAITQAGFADTLTKDTLQVVLVMDSVVEPKVDVFQLQDDHPIVVQLDNLVNDKYLQFFSRSYDTLQLNVNGYASDSIPSLPDSLLEARLAELDRQTPFDLTYNAKVKAFVNLYANRRRVLTSKVLGLADTYFPIIEPILDQHDVPLEFKYLAIVESALRPTAKSRAGATGMWQFMYATGKMYGLQVNSYYDERKDVVKSTHAACAYFNDLYHIYGNWELVMAAYNCGPGNVNKAIRRSGGKRTYWEIYRFLPRETRGYVPAFVAVNYIMHYAADHNLYATEPEFKFPEIDSVHVKEKIAFAVIAETIGMTEEEIVNLNPTYKQAMVVPDRNGHMALILPKNKAGLFITNEDSIYSFVKKVAPLVAEKKAVSEERKVHVVRSGEYLGGIATRYHVGLSQLKDWNGLHSSRIYPGQRLVVYVPEQSTHNRPTPTTTADGTKKYHTVQSGDTLWDIAKARGMSVNELKRLNQNLNFNRLKPGSKIVVGNAG